MNSSWDQPPLQSGLPPANDRMLTTLFLAALFHGIVILGVTFSASNKDAGGPDAPALEVVLVDEQVPKAASNPDARYLSRRTQLGSGNASKREETSIPRSSAAQVDQTGRPGGTDMAAAETGQDLGDEALLATGAPSLEIFYFAAPLARELSLVPQLLEKKPDLGMTPNSDGIELRLRGAARQTAWVAADTRESDVAVYLDNWRRKIERVGTMNFPDAARRKLSGTPVIEVTIGADGRLLQALVRRSSGHAELDEAAVRILKLAAPYDPFPRELDALHDEIRIAYEWQFLGGAAQGTSVLYARPGAAGTAP